MKMSPVHRAFWNIAVVSVSNCRFCIFKFSFCENSNRSLCSFFQNAVDWRHFFRFCIFKFSFCENSNRSKCNFFQNAVDWRHFFALSRCCWKQRDFHAFSLQNHENLGNSIEWIFCIKIIKNEVVSPLKNDGAVSGLTYKKCRYLAHFDLFRHPRTIKTRYKNRSLLCVLSTFSPLPAPPISMSLKSESACCASFFWHWNGGDGEAKNSQNPHDICIFCTLNLRQHHYINTLIGFY